MQRRSAGFLDLTTDPNKLTHTNKVEAGGQGCRGLGSAETANEIGGSLSGWYTLPCDMQGYIIAVRYMPLG